MILVVDCGNTMIKFGLFNNDNLIKNYSIKTDRTKSSDEYGILFKTLLKEVDVIEKVIISSVVPSLTKVLYDVFDNFFNVKALILNKEIKTGLALKIDNPNELGSDMLAGAIGAKSKFNYPCLVCDVGTATKIYIIDKNGSFIGGIISNGLGISLNSLVDSTSLLLEVPLIAPSKIIGKNTKDCIQSGIVNGQALMINEFVKQIEKELGYKTNHILTGGYSSSIINKLEDFIFEKNLILEGLFEILKKNSYEK